MKIVLNDCYGGFGLSDTAEDLYAEKSGFKLYRYKQTKYKHCDGEVAYERCKPGEEKGIFTCTMKKDLGDSFSDYPGHDHPVPPGHACRPSTKSYNRTRVLSRAHPSA